MAVSSAQNFVSVEEIREDTVVLKDGSVRIILMCSSINFALKSPEEQDAVTFQYQNFLNSLDFPIQMVVQSRKLNITPYIETLKQRQKEETNDLMKIQITEYIEFVKSFVELSTIMSKTFYAIVPYTPPIIEKRRGLISGLTSALKFESSPALKDVGTFAEFKNQAWQRVDVVVGGLQRFGVRSVPLKTEELIELFYSLYNPTEFEKMFSTESES